MSGPLFPLPTPPGADEEILSAPKPPAPPLPPAGHVLAVDWARANPVPASLVGLLALTLAIFYGAVPLIYMPLWHKHATLSEWIWQAWNAQSHYEHGPLVPLIIIFLIWNALPKLRGVPATPSMAGLVPFAFGVFLYLLCERALQPRLAWAGLPFLIWGGVLYVAGWRWARVLLFPLLCVFFLIPVPGIDQATVQLQVLATKAANVVCNAIGIKMVAVGTTLRAVDDNFQFQVIGDCSGINSLMAITLMTAVFAHLTQNRLWKMLVLFAVSAPVAIIGNIARLTSIMLVAKCFGQAVAGGWFHEISAYLVSFPFAFATLCLVNKLLNWNESSPPPAGGQPQRKTWADQPTARSADARPLAVPGGVTPAGNTPTYDY